MIIQAVHQLKQPVTGRCRVCRADGAHTHLDKNLGGLICIDCIAPVLIATALLNHFGFTHSTDPQNQTTDH